MDESKKEKVPLFVPTQLMDPKPPDAVSSAQDFPQIKEEYDKIPVSKLCADFVKRESVYYTTSDCSAQVHLGTKAYIQQETNPYTFGSAFAFEVQPDTMRKRQGISGPDFAGSASVPGTVYQGVQQSTLVCDAVHGLAHQRLYCPSQNIADTIYDHTKDGPVFDPIKKEPAELDAKDMNCSSVNPEVKTPHKQHSVSQPFMGPNGQETFWGQVKDETAVETVIRLESLRLQASEARALNKLFASVKTILKTQAPVTSIHSQQQLDNAVVSRPSPTGKSVLSSYLEATSIQTNSTNTSMNSASKKPGIIITKLTDPTKSSKRASILIDRCNPLNSVLDRGESILIPTSTPGSAVLLQKSSPKNKDFLTEKSSIFLPKTDPTCEAIDKGQPAILVPSASEMDKALGSPTTLEASHVGTSNVSQLQKTKPSTSSDCTAHNVSGSVVGHQSKLPWTQPYRSADCVAHGAGVAIASQQGFSLIRTQSTPSSNPNSIRVPAGAFSDPPQIVKPADKLDSASTGQSTETSSLETKYSVLASLLKDGQSVKLEQLERYRKAKEDFRKAPDALAHINKVVGEMKATVRKNDMEAEKKRYVKRKKHITRMKWGAADGSLPKCMTCGLSCDSRFGLTRHVAWCHVPKLPMKCKVCGHLIKTATFYQYHQLKHSRVRPFACHYCPKRFKQISALHIHIIRHRFRLSRIIENVARGIFSSNL